jgi:imidazolonepropionase-like amidohydrolase
MLMRTRPFPSPGLLVAVTLAALVLQPRRIHPEVRPALSPEVRRYVAVEAPRVVLTHVRVVDGTGAPAVADRNVVIENGRITQIGPGESVAPAEGQVVLDRPGHTVLPGLVGMHDHLFHIARPNLRGDGRSDPPLIVPQMTFSAPLLYLASGVTTIRTTGSVEPYADLNLARAIEEGRLVGPHVDVTAPYLEGGGSPFLQMHPLRDAADARRMVEYWADQGATSFKAYMYITREELEAAIEAAHARGLKVTGHLCSVTYPEAAALGIDDLEHGFFVNTQLDPGKKPDECPASGGAPTLQAMDPAGDAARQLIATLVAHKVAITSTLPVFEHRVPNRPPLQPRVLDAMSPQAREAFLLARSRRAGAPVDGALADFRRAMALERAFVAAGGLLIAGPDPTGNGGTLPGFGDQRELELLVEAGFAPTEAIRIATHNGALYLGRADRIGSLAPGRNADLVLVKGDPATRIEDVENVELVFKDGVGYDTAKLLDAVRGRYGQY